MGSEYKAKPYVVEFYIEEPVKVEIWAYSKKDARNLAEIMARDGGAFIYDSTCSEVGEIRRGNELYVLNNPYEGDSKGLKALRKAKLIPGKDITNRKEKKGGQDA